MAWPIVTPCEDACAGGAGAAPLACLTLVMTNDSLKGLYTSESICTSTNRDLYYRVAVYSILYR